MGSFIGEWVGRRILAKARQEVRFKGTTSTVSMDENGVDLVGAAGNSHLVWSAVLPPALYPDGVLLKVSRISVAWLPDSALTEGSAADVWMGFETDGCREAAAVFEVREEAMQPAGCSAAQAAGVFGVAELEVGNRECSGGRGG
jgi:hypothetical protein